MDNGSTVNVVFGGVLINNLVVLCVCVFFTRSCYVWGGMGWGGAITSWYANVLS